MRFHSVRGALRWYAKAVKSDGVRSVWPSRETLMVQTGKGGKRDEMDAFLTRWAIMRAMEELHEGERRVLGLVYLEDLEVYDIASRWNRHPSRVYAMLRRASGRVTQRLRAEGLLEDPCQIRCS